MATIDKPTLKKIVQEELTRYLTEAIGDISPEIVSAVNVLVDSGITSGSDLRAVIDLVDKTWQSAQRVGGPANAGYFVSRTIGTQRRFAKKQRDIATTSAAAEREARANTFALKAVVPVREWKKIVKHFKDQQMNGLEASLAGSVTDVLGLQKAQDYAERAGIEFPMNLSDFDIS